MKRILLLLVALALITPAAKADEGMWLPLFIKRLNQVDMQKMGLQLTAEEIYSINNSSLKDAIIMFGGGCTGEIISSQGLILTNHHCGYGQIQKHSTVEHDYLANGFWAMNLEEELPNPGLTARFLVRIEDYTEKMLEGFDYTTSEQDRADSLNARSSRFRKEAVKDTHYEAEIGSFFEGNEFYLFVYEIFQDVRFVGAPPSSIGKYGADTDNWMWPRHTGDFAMFRVYADKDNKPASYSSENVPYQPRQHLKVNVSGVKKGDFSMIMGYPGRTDRYLTSWGVDLAIEKVNPAIVKLRDKKLAIMRSYMDEDPAVKIQYASKYARTANYWKYFIGQTKGLKRLKVADQKAALEAEFNTWANATPDRQEVYGPALKLIEDGYKQYSDYALFRWYFIEAGARGPEILGFARSFGGLAAKLEDETATQEDIDQMITGLRTMTEGFFKDYNAQIDEEIMAAMLDTYYEDMDPAYHPAFMVAAYNQSKGDFTSFADLLFRKSIFADKERVMEFLDDPKAKRIKKDLAYRSAVQFFDLYFSQTSKIEDARMKMSKGKRLFVDGLRKMNPEKTYYPDANSTMRLTYGRVLDYYPADAVHFNYYTTLAGVMEKEDPSNWEFVVPGKLKELYDNKDYGIYGENGIMKVCFLTDHDITGGNSGSPVLNARGELIGLAFDGNWEAMSGDIAFEPELQRTINVDIRYVLFIIDKYAGATNIIDELDLVRSTVPVPMEFDGSETDDNTGTE